MREEAFTKSSLVKSVPIQLCAIIDGGSFTTLSIPGSQFHISLIRFKKTMPASFAGAVITIMEYCSPFDHALTLIERVQEGRIICMVISIFEDKPRILSSALITISFAVCPY